MAVKFCEMCDNMLYVKVDADNTLSFSCQYCHHSVPGGKGSESVFVSKTVYNNNSSKYQQYMTPMLHEDPSLPHIDNVPCPNEECTRKEGEKEDVIYVKYDATNLKFLYSCAYCKHFWT